MRPTTRSSTTRGNADLTAVAVAHEGLALGGPEPPVGRVGHHERLPDRHHGGGERQLGERPPVTVAGRSPARLLTDGETGKLAVLDAVDAAARGASDLAHAACDGTSHRAGVTSLPDEAAQPDQLAERGVLPLDALHQARILERVRRRLREAGGRLEVETGVARRAVEQLDDADDATVGDHRQRDAGLVAPALHALASRPAQPPVVQAGHRVRATGTDGGGAQRDVAEGGAPPLPGAVPGAVGEAHQADELVALEPAHLTFGRAAEIAEPARHRAQHLVGALGEPGRHLEVDIDERGEVGDLATQGDDVVGGSDRRGAGACGGARASLCSLAQLLRREQGFHVGAPIAAMAPGTTVAAETAVRGGAAQGVGADAEEPRRVGDAQPLIAPGWIDLPRRPAPHDACHRHELPRT